MKMFNLNIQESKGKIYANIKKNGGKCIMIHSITFDEFGTADFVRVWNNGLVDTVSIDEFDVSINE